MCRVRSNSPRKPVRSRIFRRLRTRGATEDSPVGGRPKTSLPVRSVPRSVYRDDKQAPEGVPLSCATPQRQQNDIRNRYLGSIRQRQGLRWDYLLHTILPVRNHAQVRHISTDSIEGILGMRGEECFRRRGNRGGSHGVEDFQVTSHAIERSAVETDGFAPASNREGKDKSKLRDVPGTAPTTFTASTFGRSAVKQPSSRRGAQLAT
jgi:hypothetical protein